jgi:prepilin-type N-terminal cleavage/methylation domain-containing protein/prepilin-type processing-associated H-X9-DG protein
MPSARPAPRPPRTSGFTLVELLVVIGIIAVLIAILLPALNEARVHANAAKCLSQEKQIALAILMYVNDSKGILPGPCLAAAFDPYTVNAVAPATTSLISQWYGNTFYDTRVLSSMQLLQPYVGGPDSREVWFCPANNDQARIAPCAAASFGAGKAFGYGYRINNDASDTGCTPSFLFGVANQSDTVAEQTPKRVTKIQYIVSETTNVAAFDAAKVWLLSDIDARNFDTNTSPTFGIQIGGTGTTAAKNAYALQPVHRASSDLPKGLGRNFAFLDGHCEFKLFYNWPEEAGVSPP